MVTFEIYKLEKNYRCRSAIAQAAQRLVEHNTNRVAKVTLAVKPGGMAKSYVFANPAQELSFVSASLATATSAAVLARTNRLAAEAADFLKAKGIKVATSVDQEEPEDWRRAKLLLTVISNTYNDMAVYQYIKAKLGKDEADKIKRDAAISMRPMCECAGVPTDMSAVGLRAEGISSESRQRIHEACEQLSARGQWSIPELLLYLHSGFRTKPDSEGVVVTTLHGAKGMEFDDVVIIGCEEGFLPSGKSVKAGESAVEEERRLMFVGMTRARERLVLTYCSERPQYRGQNVPAGPPEPREPSRFLREAGL